jgi:hypothetical protein
LDPDETTFTDDLKPWLRNNAPVTFDLVNLLEVENDACWELMRLITANTSEFQLRLGPDSDNYPTLFEATLGIMLGDEDVGLAARSLEVVKQAAVLTCPEALPVAASRIEKRATELKLKGITVARIRKELEDLARSVDRATRDAEVADDAWRMDELVTEFVQDAPVPSGCVVPQGWHLSEDGIYLATDQGQSASAVIPVPVVITTRLIDNDEHNEYVEIAWKKDGNWNKQLVPRSVVANTRSIVDMAAYGLPVTSNNAKVLVDYLLEFELENGDSLHRAYVSKHLGWHGSKGQECFLVGKRLVVPGGKIVAPKDVMKVQPEHRVLFRGADDGDEQLAAGFTTAGDFAAWRDAIFKIAHLPRVMLALYASLAAPLLRLLTSANFIVSFDGPTSRGKTTALRVAASVWGKPESGSEVSAMFTWDATRVSRGRTAAVLRNLPFVVDDTRTAKWKDDVPAAIYEFTSGRDKGRGSKSGLARSGTWNSIMLSSGEAPITSFTKDDGTRARVLGLWGSPFGAASQETGQLVCALNKALVANHGHAGLLFVKFLLQHRGSWDEWREEYNKSLQRYQEQAGDDSVAHRTASAFAALDMAAWLVVQAMDLPWEYADPIEPLWDELTSDAADADRAMLALQAAVDWALRHVNDFYGRQNSNQFQPSGGWAGRWDDKPGTRNRGAGSTRDLGFFPGKLREVLEAAGFDFDAVVRSWKDCDWIHVDSDGRARKKVRLGADVLWLIAIKGEALEEMGLQEKQEEL